MVINGSQFVISEESFRDVESKYYFDGVFRKGGLRNQGFPLTEVNNVEYQRCDLHELDYRLYNLEDQAVFLRGPRPDLEPGRYIVFVGAAQVFGRGVKDPFPQLVAHELGLELVNLGFGAAGPKFFQRKLFLDLINQARLCVINIMSARSVDFGPWKSGGTTNFFIPPINRMLYWKDFFYHFLRSDRMSDEEKLDVIRTCQDALVEDYATLNGMISVPLVFTSFHNKKLPGSSDRMRYNDERFPQFIDQATLERIESLYDHAVDGNYIEQNPWQNCVYRYYPTQQHHRDFAARLSQYLHDLPP